MTELVKKLVNEIEDLNDGWRDASVNPPEKIKNRYILVWGRADGDLQIRHMYR